MHGTLRLLAKASSSQSLAFCLLVIVTAFEVFAQSASTGALTGTVTDPTGAVVPSADRRLRARPCGTRANTAAGAISKPRDGAGDCQCRSLVSI